MFLVDTMNGGRSFGSSYPRFKGLRLFPFRSPSTKGVFERQAMSKEEWRPVPGYEGKYDVSNMGRVRSYISRSKKHPSPHGVDNASRGYKQVTLSQPRKTIKVHRLVMLAFAGKSSLVIDHVNSDKTDNRLENLEYVTPAENSKRYHRKNRETGASFKARSKTKPWQCQVNLNGKVHCLGYYRTKQECWAVKNKFLDEYDSKQGPAKAQLFNSL